MLACLACSMLWMNNWQVHSLCTLDSHRTAVKPSGLARRKTFFSFKILIHDFHEQNNSFHIVEETNYDSTLTQYVSYRGIDVKILGVAQQWKQKFSLLPLLWEICTELRNSRSKNICFFKNADSWFLMNTIICSISVTLCEAQKPLAEMEILQVYGELATISLEPWPFVCFYFVLHNNNV